MSGPNGSMNFTNGVSGVNGHSQEMSAEGGSAPLQPPPHIPTLLEELQVPFDAPLVRWRANETKVVQRRLYGLCLPYADPRAYKDRLNFLLSPTGWRDKFVITTTATKILVTCELSIDELGCHSATGEEWSKNENAATCAEAQSFKRACAGFGLGRYFYYFTGQWLPLDHQKRPEANPPLPEWATPEGWRRGLRPLPNPTPGPPQAGEAVVGHISSRAIVERGKGTGKNVVQEIRSMEVIIGSRLYRGLLKTLARVWNPADIRELAQQRKVLQHMEAAYRGLRRMEAALKQLNEQVANEIFRSLDVADYWLDFVEGIGVERSLNGHEACPQMKNLISFFRRTAAEGTLEAVLAGFYVYESQVPRISREKWRGLTERYGASDRTCGYFILHTTADLFHSWVWRVQLEKRLKSNPDTMDAALKAAEATARHLWEALDGIETVCLERLSAAR